ncbi:hypothetical protein GCM10010988_28940 [Cnuibacter physcomitrellae]|uniref:Uncharacterized protein n=1 Tax=Cnuibacter physcomitrellae TaxID=1619308 RepID=A0A1X9LG55_9MICO|nr:hypothetical protein [Cnuibacter physcomitrellae]ARJ04164.1 hypothetical protein B5808_02170 [Cnuibacter physcomitrellae]GGI40410.1 hypothetical protein GCM10010988_28940 [Cnuibacter physcomitrellae]
MGDDDNLDLGTVYGAAKFGSRTATPRILTVYAGVGGHHEPVQRLRLTRGTAQELRAGGYTMVRVRHRFRTYEISLTRYLGLDR